MGRAWKIGIADPLFQIVQGVQAASVNQDVFGSCNILGHAVTASCAGHISHIVNRNSGASRIIERCFCFCSGSVRHGGGPLATALCAHGARAGIDLAEASLVFRPCLVTEWIGSHTFGSDDRVGLITHVENLRSFVMERLFFAFAIRGVDGVACPWRELAVAKNRSTGPVAVLACMKDLIAALCRAKRNIGGAAT